MTNCQLWASLYHDVLRSIFAARKVVTEEVLRLYVPGAVPDARWNELQQRRADLWSYEALIRAIIPRGEAYNPVELPPRLFTIIGDPLAAPPAPGTGGGGFGACYFGQYAPGVV